MKTKIYLPVILLGLFFSVCEKGMAQAPSWQWAKGIGGTLNEGGYSISVDASGNVYTTGAFVGTVDFNPGAGVFNLTTPSFVTDIFISKLNPSGNFVWAKRIGSTGEDEAYAIAVDAAGNTYTTGQFLYTVDFDPGTGVFNLSSPGGGGVFIIKLDAGGNFVWAKAFNGNGGNSGGSIALDVLGNIYTTGYFRDTVDFDPGPAVYNLISVTTSSDKDIFISKLDNMGNFIWAKKISGANDKESSSIAVDSSGNVYTTGWFKGTTDFDPGVGVFNLTSAGSQDIFVSKLDSSGNFQWAKRIGGAANDDIANSITTDFSGNVYFTGAFMGTVDFDPGAGILNLSAVSVSTYLSKLDSSGNLMWAKTTGGGSGSSEGQSIDFDNSGNVISAGSFAGTVDFNSDTAGTFNLSELHGLFIWKMDTSGHFVWAKEAYGTNFIPHPHSLKIDANGNTYLTGGFFNDTIIFDTHNLECADPVGDLSGDIFIAKLGPCSARFSVYPDTVPQNWIALNQASGIPPLTYTWSWGDGNTSTGASPSHTYSTPGYYNICLTINDANGCSSTYCDSSTYLNKGNNTNSIITINVLPIVSSGIDDQSANDNGVSIYPNPVSDVLNVSLNKPLPVNTVITISDMQGRMVGEKNTNHTQVGNSMVITINVSALSPGVYLLRVDGVVKRFLKF